MIDRVAELLRQQCKLEPSDRLVVGVSGGPDSLCLLHVLHTLGYRPVVAHLDHQLRPESAAEARLVGVLASELGLEFVAQSADVRARAALTGSSVEEAARNLRYAFLFEQARRCAAHAVAVGHTADDQVETVIMHLVRGSGLGGLSGMSYRTLLPLFDSSIPVIRPLLGTWRRETVEYCRSHSLPLIRDPSNESLEYFRNRVRHELVPALESYNPQVREALRRTAESLGADLGIVEARVAEAWQETVLRHAPRFVGFDALELSRQPVAVQRRLILLAAARLAPTVEVGFGSVDRAAGFLATTSSGRIDLGGGLQLFRESSSIFLALGEEALPADGWPQIDQALRPFPRGAMVRMPLGRGWQFTAEYSAPPRWPGDSAPQAGECYRACLDAQSLPDTLELRPPRPGDRVQPLGMQGHSQKLSDVFINAKLPARARRRWPLLCSGGTLVWVPGFRVAEPFRIGRKTQTAACFAVSRAP